MALLLPVVLLMPLRAKSAMQTALLRLAALPGRRPRKSATLTAPLPSMPPVRQQPVRLVMLMARSVQPALSTPLPVKSVMLTVRLLSAVRLQPTPMRLATQMARLLPTASVLHRHKVRQSPMQMALPPQPRSVRSLPPRSAMRTEQSPLPASVRLRLSVLPGVSVGPIRSSARSRARYSNGC